MRMRHDVINMFQHCRFVPEALLMQCYIDKNMSNHEYIFIYINNSLAVVWCCSFMVVSSNDFYQKNHKSKMILYSVQRVLQVIRKHSSTYLLCLYNYIKCLSICLVNSLSVFWMVAGIFKDCKRGKQTLDQQPLIPDIERLFLDILFLKILLMNVSIRERVIMWISTHNKGVQKDQQPFCQCQWQYLDNGSLIVEYVVILTGNRL